MGFNKEFYSLMYLYSKQKPDKAVAIIYAPIILITIFKNISTKDNPTAITKIPKSNLTNLSVNPKFFFMLNLFFIVFNSNIFLSYVTTCFYIILGFVFLI